MKQFAATVYLLLFLQILIFPPSLDGRSPSPENEGTRQNWLRPGLQFLIAMAYSQTRYWIKYSQFIEDWQYHFNWTDQSRRWFTLDAWRFDSNAFSLNWTHALSGSIYTNIARSNGLNLKNAFLFSLAASAYWEYLVEWREVVSINDMIFTPCGGTIMGELWHRLSRSLHNRPSPRSKLISKLINPLLIVNPVRRYQRQEGDDWFCRGDLSLNLGREDRSSEAKGRFTQIASLAFTVQKAQHPAPFGQFRLNFHFADSRFARVDFSILTPYSLSTIPASTAPRFSTNWAGAVSFYLRRAVADYDGSAFKIRHSPEALLEIPRNYQDKMAVIHLLGPQLHHHLHLEKLKIRNTLSVFFDFSLCNALALNEYSRDHDLHDLTSTAFAYGYYYGAGLSAFLETCLETPLITMDIGLSFTQAWSLNGLDRFDEPLGNPATRDSLFAYRAKLNWFPADWPLGLSMRIDGRQRRGLMGQAKAAESSFTLTAGLLIPL